MVSTRPTEFHILSFEGSDAYSRAGGIATRITGLTRALATAGYPSHLWFIGDPHLPGHESDGNLHLHRWCQWISQYHPAGVYDGEEGKRADYSASLPPFVFQQLEPQLRQGHRAVVLAEEWHTADAVLHLDWLLNKAGLRDRVALLWTANNVFGFDRIDWARLKDAAVITTVSRYMKQRMQSLDVDPIVIPNGIDETAFVRLAPGMIRDFRQRFQDRMVLAKVARWDPDKRWIMAMEIVHQLKRQGAKPLLIARGGLEAHGQEVIAEAKGLGLRIARRSAPYMGGHGLLGALDELDRADVVIMDSHLDPEAKGLLYRASSAVLANSSHEPFGLVALEAMAVGGVACTGCSGEDYAVAGRNALVLQTGDPREFVGLMNRLRKYPDEERSLRREGLRTARQYVWPEIVRRNLLPRIELAS